MLVRPVRLEDLSAVQAIYAIEVLEGTASFETTPPDLDEIERRYRAVRAAGLPFVAAELDGEIGGFAYAAPYRSRPAYFPTVETSIYIARTHRRRGLGSALMDEVVKGSLEAGKREMVAVIGDSANRGSVRVHEKAGFRVVGTLRNVGFKFNRFLDTVIMQRSLTDEQVVG